MNHPKFKVGEEVILQSSAYPEHNGVYIIERIIKSTHACRLTGQTFIFPGECGFGYLFTEVFADTKGINPEFEITWAESALRKRHERSDFSFSQLMNSLNSVPV